jgi:MFS family permease
VLCALGPQLVRALGPRSAPVFATRACSILGAGLLAPWGYVQSKAALFALVGAQSVVILILPAMRSMLSAAHPKAEQGRVLGAVSIAETLGQFVTPLIGGYLWKATVEANAAPLSFVVLAACVGLAGIASCMLRPLECYDDSLPTLEARDSDPEHACPSEYPAATPSACMPPLVPGAATISDPLLRTGAEPS